MPAQRAERSRGDEQSSRAEQPRNSGRSRKAGTGAVRITSGTLRGRTLLTPGDALTHPMGAREKLALFNMINEHLPGSSVLDVFAGSGALGIEALSRGAKAVLFIDNDRRACEVIKQNLAGLGLSDSASRVLKGNVFEILDSLPEKFELIIADPPYDAFDANRIGSLVRVLAHPGGILVLSHPGEAPEIPEVKLLKTRRYARAHISIYQS